jgi:hypothetical protein
MNWNKSITLFLRNWHRDLGYFTVAVALVYGLSGIFLTHKDVFKVIAVHETYLEYTPGMKIAEFAQHWSKTNPALELSKCFTRNNAVHFYYKGGKGAYDIETGKTAIESYKTHRLIALLNHLHFNQIKGWKYVADFFSIALMFLAVSGLVIVKGKKGFKKRGLWIMLAGLAMVAMFLFF